MKDTDFCAGYDCFIYELIFLCFIMIDYFYGYIYILFEFLFINYNLKKI